MSDLMNVRKFDNGSAQLRDCRDPATQMIDVGGRRLAFTCTGQGSPAVVLETGLGAESSEWAAVQRGVQKFARVCRYDRAGRGMSDRAASPRTALDMVNDLRSLLRAAAVPSPYVLVGQSFGGLLMRMYALQHSSEVVGLVLVDSMHEDQFDVFGQMFPPPTPADTAVLQEVRAFWTGGWRNVESTVEHIDFLSSIRQARKVTALGDVPLHVITAGTFLNQPLVPAARRTELQQRWEDLQKQFLNLSSRATQSIVPASGHFVQRDDPHVVIDAIEAVMRQCQRLFTGASNPLHFD